MLKIVKWSYKHHLNSTSVVTITKRGVYYRAVESRQGMKKLAVVHFDGNKHDSRVPFDELVFTGEQF